MADALFFRIQDGQREATTAPLVLYGIGPQARVVFSFVSRYATVAGFTVDDGLAASGEGTLEGLPVVPLSQVQKQFSPERHAAIVAVGYGEMNDLRERKTHEMSRLGYSLTSYIDPSVSLPSKIVVGANCVILDHVSLHTGTAVGEGTFISSGAVIGHDCVVGPYNWIGSGTTFAGNVQVGASCFFGLRVCVAHRVTIGERCFLGSQSLVAKDVVARSTIVAKSGETLPVDSAAFLALTC